MSDEQTEAKLGDAGIVVAAPPPSAALRAWRAYLKLLERER